MLIVNSRIFVLWGIFFNLVTAFTCTSPTRTIRSNGLLVGLRNSNQNEDSNIRDFMATSSTPTDRRTFGSAVLGGFVAATAAVGSSSPAFADDGRSAEEGFESIAARASKLAGEVGEKTVTRSTNMRGDTRTAFDFTLPMEGELKSMKDIVHQETNEDGFAKVKAILYVNLKQDDPIARKDIPEFISLASKYVHLPTEFKITLR